MSAVLRIALSTFSFVPLQRVLNFIGGPVMAIALLWELLRPESALIATFFMAMGMLLIVLTPFGGGGAALRYASTPSLLHLRPRGRLRMLLGAGLGITFVATLVVFPFAMQKLMHLRGGPPPSDVPLVPLFTVMWISTALAWAGMFGVLGARRQLLPIVFIIPFAIGPVARFVGTSSVAVAFFVFGSLAAIAAFVGWYARTDLVRRPGASCNPTPWGLGLPYWQGTPRESQPMPSSAGVLRQYLLGSASLATPMLSSLMLVAFMGLMAALPLFMGKQHELGLNPFLFLMLATMGMSAATQGHIIARRARLLWLRAGLDRSALFALAGRQGLVFTALAYVIPMVALLGSAIWLQPEQTSALLAYGVAVLASGICLLYAGLSTTHDWDFADIALMSFMALLQIFMVVLTRPGAANSIAWALGFTAALAVLARVLRAHALRRWLELDWRVMRMLQTRR